jgi:hypothetical protein
VFAHPVVDIEALLTREGWVKDFERLTWVWRVVVYRRSSAEPAASG